MPVKAVPSLSPSRAPAMAPKRARTATAAASASSSSHSADGAAPKLTLHGGVPHHPSLAGLWHDHEGRGWVLGGPTTRLERRGAPQ